MTRLIFRNRRVVAAIMASLISSALAAQSNSAVAKKTGEEDDIREAVIRYQFAEWIQNPEIPATDERARIFFIGVDGEDPSDAFLNRFHDVPRIIKKVSEATAAPPHSEVIDKTTGRGGVILTADAIHWRNNNSVQVEGGYFCGGLCAARVIYKLHRENGKWVIKSSRVTSQS